MNRAIHSRLHHAWPSVFYEQLAALSEPSYGEFQARLEVFAPHIDNWATCDIISPDQKAELRALKRNRAAT